MSFEIKTLLFIPIFREHKVKFLNQKLKLNFKKNHKAYSSQTCFIRDKNTKVLMISRGSIKINPVPSKGLGTLPTTLLMFSAPYSHLRVNFRTCHCLLY